jgi:hypothetical protein
VIQTGYGPFLRGAQSAKQRGYLNFSLYDVPHWIPNGWMIVEAELRFRLVTYDSPDVFETLGVFDVSTAPLLLAQIGGQDPSIYEDLGTGEMYGSADVTAANAPFTVKLNQAAVTAIKRNLGGSFAVGLSLLTLRPNPSSVEMLFKGQAASSILHMRYARVPEPSAATMVVFISAASGPAWRRRLPMSRERLDGQNGKFPASSR